MIALEYFIPGSGSHAVAAHLAAVQAQAQRDLRAAPVALEYFDRVLEAWAGDVRTRDRALLDRVGPALAVSQFSRLLPPQTATGRRAGEAARHVAVLRTHGWLVLAVTGPARTMYRAAVGAPFGVPARAT